VSFRRRRAVKKSGRVIAGQPKSVDPICDLSTGLAGTKNKPRQRFENSSVFKIVSDDSNAMAPYQVKNSISI
jgi:hypothetical protein